MRMADIRPGWTVVANDGQRVATVREVGQNYVVASRGPFTGELFVPSSAIANVEGETLYLNLAKDQVEAMGWEQRPRGDDEPVTDESDLHRHI